MSEIINTQELIDYMAPKKLRGGLVQSIVSSANAYVERETKRCWGETVQVTERHDWRYTVWLRHQDVVTVDAVKIGRPGSTQSTLGIGSYHHNGLGRLTLYWPYASGAPSRAGRDYLEVTYTYGVEDVPGDLKLATLGIAAGFLNWAAAGNKDVTAKSMGSYSVTYGNKAPVPGESSSAASTTAANFAIIRSYATRRL